MSVYGSEDNLNGWTWFQLMGFHFSFGFALVLFVAFGSITLRVIILLNGSLKAF